MHEIEITNGKAQMAYAGETPWHGLGKRVSPDLAPVEMMREAGVDWKVKKRPSFIRELYIQVPFYRCRFCQALDSMSNIIRLEYHIHASVNPMN